MDNQNTTLLKPAQYAEHRLLTAILGGEYPPGTILPGERVLAQELGVTRPTLRETLHRLAGEGWITIQHGKATTVNDFWKQGGLGLLSTMSRYGQYLPSDFITHLLELRVVLIPAVAAIACTRNPGALADHLARADSLEEDAEAYTQYDWDLQVLMGEASNNRTFPMILNDFGPLFRNLGRAYFTLDRAQEASQKYYKELSRALKEGPESVREAAKDAMEESISIWNDLNDQEGDDND